MKKILITGAGSYIGTSFAEYLAEHFPADYRVDTLDMIGDSWKSADFSGYDAIFHVAGIAHQKETRHNAPLYYTVNRDLAEAVARKAKQNGVKLMVFLSTMSVYGMETGTINKDTIPHPRSHYGRSKLEAEQLLLPLQDDHFAVAVLRPPMVYGKGCRGNFQSVVKLVRKLPIFPKVNNQRSMIHIDTLCAYVEQLIRNGEGGLHLPQNSSYMNTSEMACYIAEALGKKLRLSTFLGFCVRLARPFLKPLQKAFGSLIYVQDVPEQDLSNKDSVIRSI